MKANNKFEEGGVLGIFDRSGLDVPALMYYGMCALQHRGQTGCGVVCNDNYRLNEAKGKGLVNQVIEPVLSTLKGNMAVGHLRYGNNYSGTESALPLNSIYVKGSLTISLAGVILNSDAIKLSLENEGGIFQVGNDAEILAHLIARERVKTGTVEEAVKNVAQSIDGAYAAIVLSPKKLMAFRDKQGLRPLCLGALKDSFIVASESTAFDAFGATLTRDVLPGEMIVCSDKGVESYIAENAEEKPCTCVYEYMYFARPDSVMDGISVYETRLNAGKELFRAHPADADVVIGVPSAGLHYALGYANASKIPFGDGLIRNYYVGRADRTSGSNVSREATLSTKLNVLKSAVDGKRVVLVDDSLIKGETAQRIIARLKENGAKEVHLRLGTPRFFELCPYSPSVNTVLADLTDEQIRVKTGADSIGFLPHAALEKTGLKPYFCKKCFGGEER